MRSHDPSAIDGSGNRESHARVVERRARIVEEESDTKRDRICHHAERRVRFASAASSARSPPCRAHRSPTRRILWLPRPPPRSPARAACGPPMEVGKASFRTKLQRARAVVPQSGRAPFPTAPLRTARRAAEARDSRKKVRGTIGSSASKAGAVRRATEAPGQQCRVVNAIAVSSVASSAAPREPVAGSRAVKHVNTASRAVCERRRCQRRSERVESVSVGRHLSRASFARGTAAESASSRIEGALRRARSAGAGARADASSRAGSLIPDLPLTRGRSHPDPAAVCTTRPRARRVRGR